MGFSRNKAVRALRLSKGDTVEAVEQIFSEMVESDSEIEDGKEEFAVPSSRLTVTCSLYMVPAVTATWAMKGHALCVL